MLCRTETEYNCCCTWWLKTLCIGFSSQQTFCRRHHTLSMFHAHGCHNSVSQRPYSRHHTRTAKRRPTLVFADEAFWSSAPATCAGGPVRATGGDVVTADSGKVCARVRFVGKIGSRLRHPQFIGRALLGPWPYFRTCRRRPYISARMAKAMRLRAARAASA